MFEGRWKEKSNAEERQFKWGAVNRIDMLHNDMEMTAAGTRKQEKRNGRILELFEKDKYKKK